ncbi:Tubulin gamma chain [Phytophthora nicotianae]|uniref:Tubulin gamma chain n=1 Tax=Phytophthora nicotianae TaxID=4792 RepID=A0A0W8D845_PHYNI|nr:Tubulin gamma chain [Phytophthora nicotianae]
MNWPEAAVTKYAALNAEQWEETMNCGRCAEVSCTDASCSGQSEIVYIMDQCPGCAYGDLDLSPDVFESITGQSYTKLSIEWKFVDCPISNNVQYCLKTGSSEFWVAVQPANCVSGVQSLSINGQETSVIDSAYYFLIDGSGESVADLNSISISIKGVNGEVLEETLSLSADECTEGSKQFSTSDVTQFTTVAGSSSPSPPTTSNPTTAPTLAPTITPESTPAATPTPTPIATSNATYNPVTPTTDSSSFISSSSSSDSTDHDVGADSAAQESGSNTVQETVAASNTVSSTIPDDAIESTVQSSGGSHSTPLMIGMIVLVCVAVMVTVGLALYVRRRKKQIDSYKRREEQGTEMSDADVSPRASDVSGYDMVHSPTVHFSSMESMGKQSISK